LSKTEKKLSKTETSHQSKTKTSAKTSVLAHAVFFNMLYLFSTCRISLQHAFLIRSSFNMPDLFSTCQIQQHDFSTCCFYTFNLPFFSAAI
jgi:hypothetical protein